MKKRLIILTFVLITVFATVALLSACDDLSGLLGGGDVDGNNEVCKHTNIRHIDAVEPSCTESGNIEYWKCDDCGMVFTDAECTNTITEEETYLAPTAHVFDGWKSDLSGHWRECSVCGYIDDNDYHSINSRGKCSVCGYTLPDENGVLYYADPETQTSMALLFESDTEDLVIESEYKGYPVTAIEGFSTLINLRSIVIPDTVKSISNAMLKGCENLTKITVPYVGASSNDGNMYMLFGSSMSDVEVPSSLKEICVTNADKIGHSSFYGFSDVEKISINCNNLSICEAYAFKDCGSLSELTLTGTFADFVEMGSDCFEDCTSLTSLVIPEGVECLEYGLFEGCTSLEEVVLPHSLKKIYNNVFNGCSSLSSITIPASIFEINYAAFNGMKDDVEIFFESNSELFTDVEYSDGATVSNYYNNVTSNEEYDYVTDGESAYITRYKGQGGQVTAPDEIDGYKVKSLIGAFCGNDNVVKVIFEEGLTEISPYMFYNSKSLEEIVLPASLKVIGGSAFKGCEKLSVIDLSVADALEEIGKYAFSYCFNLNEIFIPGSVSNIGDYAFYTTGLTSVEIGDNSSIESLGDAIFAFCHLSNFEIPAGWKEIPSMMFANMPELKEITFEEGSSLKSIEAIAFSGASIESFFIPASLTDIDTSCFGYCTKLKSFVIEDGNQSFVFDGNSLLTKDGKTLLKYVGTDASYTVPSGVENIAEDAFSDNDSIEELILPDGVKNIGPSGISSCGNLKKIVLPETLETIDYYGLSFNSSLAEVELPYSLQNVSYNAFSNNSCLKKIVVPSSVVYMGKEVFYGCYGLVVMIEAASMPEGWDPNAIGSDVAAVIWDCNNNATSENGEQYYMTDDGFTYLLKDGTAVLLSCDVTTQGDVVLPETIEYEGVIYTLKEIASYAFKNCMDLTSLVLPSTLEKIGDYAFSGCVFLRTLTIPQSVVEMGNYLFTGTYHTVVALCESASAGENWPSNWSDANDPGCNVIWSYNGDENIVSNSYYWSDDGGFYLLEGDHAVFYRQIPLIGEVITIPSEIHSGGNVFPVTLISSDAFKDCELLTKVEIEANALGSSCFKNRTSLEEVVLSDTITEISNSVFSGCTSLRIVNLPDTLQTIGDNAFNGCSSLNVEIPAGVTDIGENAFYGVASVTINEGNEIFSIKDDFILKNDTVLVGLIGTCDGELVIPDYVTEIQEHAFEYSQYLKKVVIPASVTVIGEYAFYNSTVEEVIFAENSAIKEIRSYAFANCYSLRSIVLPEGLEVIGDYAFSFCDALEKIVLPSSVWSIGVYAFYMSVNLKTVIFAEDGDLLSIGEMAFMSTSIEEVILPDGLTYIGFRAFVGNTLKTVYIPASVKYIASDVFSGNDGLTIYCEAASKPEGWSESWNSGHEVVWGYSPEQQA